MFNRGDFELLALGEGGRAQPCVHADVGAVGRRVSPRPCPPQAPPVPTAPPASRGPLLNPLPWAGPSLPSQSLCRAIAAPGETTLVLARLGWAARGVLWRLGVVRDSESSAGAEDTHSASLQGLVFGCRLRVSLDLS